MTLNQKAKMGAMVLAGVTDSDYKEKLDCYSTLVIRKNVSGI